MINFSRELPAWIISLAVNLSILSVFHFIVFQTFQEPAVNTITSTVETDVQERELNFSETVTSEEIGNEGVAAALTATLKSATAIGKNDIPIHKKIEEALNPETPQLAETSLVKLESDLLENVEVKGRSDHVPGGIEGAMDRVTFEIRQSLRERRTLVIWMFDASGSLKERREQMADRFDNVYRQLNKTGPMEGLYSVVIEFGKNTKLLTPEPVQDVETLSDVVRNHVETDESGIENVFTATHMAVEKYRTFHRHEGAWNKLIFIVTDERGDDAENNLEAAISLARRSHTKVYAIGNAAVFGRKEAYMKYTYDDGYEMLVAIDQGPESAFPDTVQLPFIGSGKNWQLNQMIASEGPYALTRLCAETGGMFLITEHSRGITFDENIMREYAPDYRPVREQALEIENNPAKAALVAVASMTYDKDLVDPQTVFRAYNDNILRTDLGEAQKPVAEIDYPLRRMLDALSTGIPARKSLKDPRWRAAFDLAVGRLLAMRVRYFGYNQMLANMKVSPKTFEKPDSNMWRLVSSPEINSGPEMRKYAEEAKEYLNRVIKEHPGTPWALLAKRELSSELGWTWEEFSQPIPGSNEFRAPEEEVARLLLAEEERRMEQRQVAEKPRPIPKL